MRGIGFPINVDITAMEHRGYEVELEKAIVGRVRRLRIVLQRLRGTSALKLQIETLLTSKPCQEKQIWL